MRRVYELRPGYESRPVPLSEDGRLRPVLGLRYGGGVIGRRRRSIEVPHTNSKSLLACALYLVCGMALMAMCFNLMQEEATNKFRRLGRRLGLLRSDDPVT